VSADFLDGFSAFMPTRMRRSQQLGGSAGDVFPYSFRVFGVFRGKNARVSFFAR